MQRFSTAAIAIALTMTGLWVPAAHAQCAFEWKPGNNLPSLDRPVFAAMEWDPDGAGLQPPLLVVGGSFTIAGDVLAARIATWDGTSWSALGTGMSGTVSALTVYNGNLIAGGAFTTAGGTT